MGKVKKLSILAFVILILIVHFSYGAHYIAGVVNDAADSTAANGHTVLLYKESVGMSTNGTDTIGPTGSSGLDNYYLIECYDTWPSNKCQVGDVMTVLVVDDGDNYVAGPVNVTVTGAAADQPPDMTLIENLAPNVSINYPPMDEKINGTIKINATVVNNTYIYVDTVIYMLENETGNLSADGQLGFSYLYRQGSTDYFNASFDTTVFADGNYTLYIVANNTFGATSVNFSNVTVNNTQSLGDINVTSVWFSNDNPGENENITLFANITNEEAVELFNVTIQFYNGNYALGNKIGDNFTINLSAEQTKTVNRTFVVSLGSYNIFAVADPDIADFGVIEELDETNNYNNNSFSVSSYHHAVGNISGELAIMDASGSSLVKWPVENISGSNVMIVDCDNSIIFSQLKPLTRTIGGTYTSDDLSELDDMLDMENFSDSLNRTYTDGNSNLKETVNLSVFGISLNFVPIVNSTNSSDFTTGILWDSSQDSGNEEFDEVDQEDVVFITVATEAAWGKYGLYDYEITVPARLRQYKGPGDSTVCFYAEMK